MKIKDIDEIYKFFFKTHFPPSDYELLGLYTYDFILDNAGNLSRFEISFSLDSFDDTMGTIRSINLNMEKISEDLIEFLHQFPINPITKKFDKNFSEFEVSPETITDYTFVLNESNKIGIVFSLSFNQ
jgi:hypothetical protein